MSSFVFGRCGDPLGEPSVLPPQVLGGTEWPGSVAPRLEGYGCRRGPDDGRRVRLWLRMGCRWSRVGGGRQGLLVQLGRGQVAGSESVLTSHLANNQTVSAQVGLCWGSLGLPESPITDSLCHGRGYHRHCSALSPAAAIAIAAAFQVTRNCCLLGYDWGGTNWC